MRKFTRCVLQMVFKGRIAEVKRNILICLAFICLCAFARGESFIVTKAGKGFWAASARKENEKILYIDKESGEEKNLPVGDVEAIIPKAQKGMQYPVDQVKSRVSSLKVLEQKHEGLTRVLNQLLQEWEAYLKEDPDFEKKVDDVAAAFNSSDKLTRAYKGATMDLGMLKYKDMSGKYTAKIDKLVEDVKKDYIVSGFARLEAMANTNKIDISDFVEVRDLAVSVSELCDAAQKQKAGMFREKARLVALGVNTRKALAEFASSKTIDAYLSGRDRLHRTRGVIASEDSHRKVIDGMIAGLMRDAGRALPAYNFEVNGYPLSRNDREMLDKYRNFSSRVSWKSDDFQEQCLMIPLKQPEKIALNRRFTLPFRLVFNRIQPKDRKYSISVYIPGVKDGVGSYSSSIPLEGLQVTNGHAEVTFAHDFDQAKDGYVPGAADDGRVHVYVTLECLMTPDGEMEKSVPISCACRFYM